MVSLKDIERAWESVQPIIRATPLRHIHSLDRVAGRHLLLKMENEQRTGSFKIRGAYHKICRLSPEEKARGVVAASAGNHAQGVALAARELGTKATIVMPLLASIPKVMATRDYGAQAVLHGETYDEAYQKALELQQEHGYTFVHAFDDPHIIAGQGTVGLEILQEAPQVEVVVVPIGGGGLISGIATAIKEKNPGVKVIGVQARGAPAIYRSLQEGRPVQLTQVRTIADGLAIKKPSSTTLDIIGRYVDDVVLVEEEQIARAMILLAERGKAIVEGAGAAALAAVLAGEVPAAATTAVLVSGGNVDLVQMARIIDHGLAQEGRYLPLVTILPDRPGALKDFLSYVAQAGANVIGVEHRRLQAGLALGEAVVNLVLETRDRAHAEDVLRFLHQAGYRVREESFRLEGFGNSPGE
ncbi:MAG: threonine ammonia-lyase [Bacillota bacterium]|nr:threonine ammonia-lyase [Bacillota bacterium]